MKLGKHPPKQDERTFQLRTYLHNEKLPPLPKEWSWGKKIKPDKWGMMRNLHLENCTCAAAGHQIMAWTSNTGKLYKPTDRVIVQTYSAITGYDPETGKNNTGAYALDVLKYWRKNKIAGHSIFAFAGVNHKDHDELKHSIYLFGGCFAGLGLPKTCVKQPVWDVPKGGAKGDGAFNSWGGHAVLLTGYSKEGLHTVTWGKEKLMTWKFWKTYGEEAYAIFSEDFISQNTNPAGIHVDLLKKDILSLKKDDDRFV